MNYLTSLILLLVSFLWPAYFLYSADDNYGIPDWKFWFLLSLSTLAGLFCMGVSVPGPMVDSNAFDGNIYCWGALFSFLCCLVFGFILNGLASLAAEVGGNYLKKKYANQEFKCPKCGGQLWETSQGWIACSNYVFGDQLRLVGTGKCSFLRLPEEMKSE